MAVTTNVPPMSFTTAGPAAPTEQAVLAGFQADINAAFGGGLSQNLETPQGQLASSESAAYASVMAAFLYICNQIDPAFATGRFQDAICRLNFLTRIAATSTTVVATCSGRTGVTVPVGALAKAQDGNIYQATTSGTFDASGTCAVTFACLRTGPIICAIGALNTVYRLIPGWDSVTNAAAGTPGRDAETPLELEARRQASVAATSVGPNTAIRGALLNPANAPGVTDCYVVDNPSANPVTVQGITLVAYELYVCVQGGDNTAVAQTIRSKKVSGGPMYSGANTTVIVQDTNGYAVPYPSYTIKFNRPSPLVMFFAVTLKNNSGIPSDYAAQVQAAITAVFTATPVTYTDPNGNSLVFEPDSRPKETIGATVFAGRYFAPISNIGSWAEVIDIELASEYNSTATVTGSFAAGVLTVTAVTSGSLAVGDALTGPNVPQGAVILSFGSGSGGTGTYNVNVQNNVASTTINASVANQRSITPNIDRLPIVLALSIQVTLQ